MPDLASGTGKLYEITTFGATIGTFTTGFLLLPTLSIRGSIYVGVILNILVALLTLLFDTKQLPLDGTAAKIHGKKKTQLKKNNKTLSHQNR